MSRKFEENSDIPNVPLRLSQAEQLLSSTLAKSASHSRSGRPVTLTEHSLATRSAAQRVADRIGPAGLLERYPRFWDWVTWATLLHDAGKIAAGFQQQLQPGGDPWRERHEVLSLAYVDLLAAHLPEDDLAMIAAGVVFHHRCLGGNQGLSTLYPPEAAWERKFGVDRDPDPGRLPKAQVTPERHAALLAWLAEELGVQLPPPQAGDREPWQRARDLFAAVEARWAVHVPEADGLIAVLLQGAVTLADHSASADVQLDTDTPVPFGYLEKNVANPYPHQYAARDTDGHLVLIAPTGSGKTESGLAWGSRQIESMPGQPRLVWLLPYRASIDAIRERFIRDFGCEADQIGVLHATVAATLLNQIVGDDRAPGSKDTRKARAMAGAMRLFRQRVRVATPYQLLRGSLGGPKHASVLLEQANSAIVLDELHAYDPVTFGRICAAMRLWEQLGSRVAVLSATLARPMIKLVEESLSQPVTVHHAPPGTAPLRHRLLVDTQPLTALASMDRIRGWLADGRSVLVVANTVATAQRIFGELSQDLDGDSALLLHSRFRYGDRRAIEKRIIDRYPQRCAGDPALRGGGLVVSTQALEVSLCLDFDRGVSELAPVEAIAQRAGRVNRLGLHPDGPVEFRVHAVASPLPYDQGAVDAAMLALQDWDEKLVSEQAIEEWLDVAYATPWGQYWTAKARKNRDEFSNAFLTFPDPFADRSEFAARLDEQLDTVEVLLSRDLDEYRERATGPGGDPMLAAELLIPIRWHHTIELKRTGRARHYRDLDVWAIDAPYHPSTGLNLADALSSAVPALETIL